MTITNIADAPQFRDWNRWPARVLPIVPKSVAKQLRLLADAEYMRWPFEILKGSIMIPRTTGHNSRESGYKIRKSTMKIAVGERWLAVHRLDLHAALIAANSGRNKGRLRIVRLGNGDLDMTVSRSIRPSITALIEAYTESKAELDFVGVHLDHDPLGDGVSYHSVEPEDVGALTAAPLISDGEHVYGFMDYQVESFLKLLARGKTVRWQRG